MRDGVDGEIWTIAREAASALGYELIDLEWTGSRGRRTLRAYIEKPGGVSLADCAAVSRELGERLEGVVEHSHRLEISSPGVERPLRRARDFERCLGRRVKMRLRGEAGGKRKISGKILGVGESAVRLLSGDGEEASFSLADIAKASLEVDWEAEFRGRGGEEAPRAIMEE